MNPIIMVYRAVLSKIMPFFNRIRIWFSWTYLSNKLNMSIRTQTTKIFKVRAKDKDDYYTIFGWMVAKPLAIAVSIAVVVLCCAYIVAMIPAKSAQKGYKMYKYNSLALKYISSERVGILGKSGYVAYEGDVKDGVIEGSGKLFFKDGTLCYAGEFQKNAYNGKGKRYYRGGELWYDGDFKDNEFDGEGTLYRQDGSKLYSGNFVNSMKDGEGSLFDTAGNEIFHGGFSKDTIVYKQLLGKASDEINEYYKAKSDLYTTENLFMKPMEGINVLCRGRIGDNTLDGKSEVDGVYVLNNFFIDSSGNSVSETEKLKNKFKKLVYQGYTELMEDDALAVTMARFADEEIKDSIKLEKTSILEDAASITGYKAELPVYVHVFHDNGCSYTFYSQETGKGFFMYLIQPISGEAEEKEAE